MNWQDKGYLLSKNKYNENSVISEFYTENHGKISGIIFGGTSKKIKNYLFEGNKLHINYNSKSQSKIGSLKVEIDEFKTPYFLEDKQKLLCIIYTMNLIKILEKVSEGNKINYKLKNSGKIIPNFLVNKDEEDISFEDTFDALKIVGDFLDKTIVKPNNLNFPKTRFNFQNSLKLI